MHSHQGLWYGRHTECYERSSGNTYFIHSGSCETQYSIWNMGNRQRRKHQLFSPIKEVNDGRNFSEIGRGTQLEIHHWYNNTALPIIIWHNLIPTCIIH